MNLEIKFEGNRTACYDNGEFVGECSFIENGDKWDLNHTFVKSEYSGKGIARMLLDALLKEARKNGVKIIPTCSFVAKITKAKEYEDLI